MILGGSVAVYGMVLGSGLNASSSPTQTEPIIGGDETAAQEYVEVGAFSVGPELCSGVMVSARIMLTAAHCLARYQEGRPVNVFSGASIDLATAVPAIDAVKHPEYCDEVFCRDDRYDFGYLVLGEDFPGYETPPLPVATQEIWDKTMRAGAPVLLVGYGQAEEDYGRKRVASAVIHGFTARKTEFLAGGEGRDSCVGDSGGPAFVQYDGRRWLAGVTSRGSAHCGEGGYYGLVFPILCWLREKSGVSLVPRNCHNECQCVDPEADPGCRVVRGEGVGALVVVWMLAGWPRRSGTGAHRTRPARMPGRARSRRRNVSGRPGSDSTTMLGWSRP